MFRLRTFGGLWLERDHQRVAGASSRWLGLLAALAASGERGVSRDRLLLLLWPDSTDSRARHALAQTLYSLRRELGDELIRSEPTELVIDPAHLGSDLAEFLEARTRGDLESAAACYTGPFLDGFYIAGADEFERWAEVERARLRDSALQVIEAAARAATEAGRLAVAVGHWRHLSALAPLNSRVAIGYLTSLAETGDVAGAIQHGRAHELARRQELGAQPDPLLGALLARLAREGWRPAAAGTLPPVGPVIRTEPPPPEPAPPAHVLVPRRPWTVAVAAVAVAGLLLWLVPPMFAGRSAFPDGSVVVMAEPADQSGEPGLGRALASAAVVGLQQSRHLTLLSRTRIADALRRMGRTGDTVLTDSLALEVAARENARAVLSLSVARVSRKYLLTARLRSPVDGSDLAVHQAAATSLDRIIESLDRLLRDIQATSGDSRGYRDSLPSLPLVTTRSLEALKLYAEGNGWWRRSRYDEALKLFERAIAVDSDFAMAHVALGSVYYFINDRPNGDLHYGTAQRLRGRLTFREQLNLDSRLASARGNRAEEVRIDQTLAERYPSRETWYNYGTSLMRSQRCREGIPALQRALTFDSTFANTEVNLATCYKALGENRLALDAYAAAERRDSTALVSNFINHEWGSTYVRLGRLGEAQAAFRRMLSSPERNDQARGHRSLAYLDLLQGHYRAAIDHLATAVLLSRESGAGLSALRSEALLAESYLGRGATALASRILDQALTDSRSQYVEPVYLALLGRVLVRAGRLRDARGVLVRLEAAVKPENAVDRSARALLSAELALARGAPDAAAEAIRNDIDPYLELWRAALTGRILAARGVLDSSLTTTAAYAREEFFGTDAQAEGVLAPLQVARLAEALGDPATARAALQTFLDRWKDADPDLAALRTARVNLTRLQREAGH